MPSAASIITKLRSKVFGNYSIAGQVQRITSRGTLNTTTALYEGGTSQTFDITYIDTNEKSDAQPINLFDVQATNQQVKRSKDQDIRSIIILADENYTPQLEDIFIDINSNNYKIRRISLIVFQGITIAYDIDLND